MRAKIDIGSRFGILLVLEYVKTQKTTSLDTGRTHYSPVLRCKCICGAEVLRHRRYLREGYSRHCGSDDCRRMARWLARESKKMVIL